MLKIAVVEDDPACAEQLRAYLGRYQEENQTSFLLSFCTDGEDIVQVSRGQLDVILMDIEMEFMDGMTAAETIRQTDQRVTIIFITNLSQYAIRGYAVDALDYVLKPISYFAFSQCLSRAIRRIQNRERSYVTVNTKTGACVLASEEIYWIESQGHRLTYHTAQGEFESTSASLKEVEDLLKKDGFVRCNKCYLVNLAHVRGYHNGLAVVHTDELPISRSRKEAFLQALTDFASEALV